MKTTRWKRSTATVLLAALLSQGCAGPGARLQYLIGEDKTVEHYRDYATSIEYPTESEARESDPNLFRAPRRITSLEEVSQRHIKLDECIKMALSNATILRDDQSFGSPGNALLANPSRVASVYDAAIQDTSFLFGNRGVDAALADFDPIFTSNLQAGKSEDPQNTANLGLNAGDVLAEDTGQFQARLEKALANSGTVAIQHDWNYSQNNLQRLFPSAYTGSIQAEYRQPLLAGGGTEFTRIAGPIAQGVRGVSGVSQGVLISRINSDISLVDFEQSVTTLVRDVETKYWDLYLALQLYESEIQTFKDIIVFRDNLYIRREAGAAEAQAANRLYESDARMKGSLADVLSAEYRLRRLLGLPLNDGDFLTPVDKPTEAPLIPNWESSLLESLANRAELRRQKWEIRSLELQLIAAKNLSRPRLDLVSQYRINGFGDKLLGGEDDDGVTDAGYASAYEVLTQGDNTGWGAGLQFSMPLGLRLARAQVRNYELRLRKARSVLQEQEQEIARELNNAILEMDRWYLLAESGAKRVAVAEDFTETKSIREAINEARDDISLGQVLESKITSRDAGQSYLRSIIEYNKAITELNFRKGTLLQANSIYLAEGQWNPAAYDDAKRRGEAMTHALDNTHVDAVPAEFTGGPAINAWESQSSPDRPHIPGVVDGIPPRSDSGATSSPMLLPSAPATQPIQQSTPMPESAPVPEPAPMQMPPQQPRRVPANTTGLTELPQSSAVQGQIRNAVKTEQAPAGRSKEVRNRMSNTGKASL
ncbi:MAG: hypothetical protein DWI00_10030 [Planctomycetota bacterium]|nr:MAG: hypothetical protein DWI00_10030 [Planctomycetota bacterium]